MNVLSVIFRRRISICDFWSLVWILDSSICKLMTIPHVQMHTSLWRCFAQRCPPLEALPYWHIGPFVLLAAPSVQADLSHCVYMQQIKKCPQSTGATMRACAAGDDEQSPSAPSSLCGSFRCKDDEIKNCVVCPLWYKDTYATTRYEATLLCDRSLLFSSAVESCRVRSDSLEAAILPSIAVKPAKQCWIGTCVLIVVCNGWLRGGHLCALLFEPIGGILSAHLQSSPVLSMCPKADADLGLQKCRFRGERLGSRKLCTGFLPNL